MSPIPVHLNAPSSALPLVPAMSGSSAIGERLGELYGLSERSNYIFGSPLGTIFKDGRHYSVPRFVYFGPHTHDESLRLAFYSGFDAKDLRGAHALLHLVERLAIDPDLGQGLNLSFFPIVDVLGTFQRKGTRELNRVSWSASEEPEIGLLQKDVRASGYHGFIRVESALTEDFITVQLRGRTVENVVATGVEIISSEDFEPMPVRWEADATNDTIGDGPLTLGEDLSFHAFELILRVPASWSADLHREVVGTVLRRFILRYRSLQAYGQHL